MAPAGARPAARPVRPARGPHRAPLAAMPRCRRCRCRAAGRRGGGRRPGAREVTRGGAEAGARRGRSPGGARRRARGISRRRAAGRPGPLGPTWESAVSIQYSGPLRHLSSSPRLTWAGREGDWVRVCEGRGGVGHWGRARGARAAADSASARAGRALTGGVAGTFSGALTSSLTGRWSTHHLVDADPRQRRVLLIGNDPPPPDPWLPLGSRPPHWQ
jgi:hypothetical protein